MVSINKNDLLYRQMNCVSNFMLSCVVDFVVFQWKFLEYSINISCASRHLKYFAKLNETKIYMYVIS